MRYGEERQTDQGVRLGPMGMGKSVWEMFRYTRRRPAGTWANGCSRPRPKDRYVDLAAVLFAWYPEYSQDKQRARKKKWCDETQAEINNVEAKRRSMGRQYGSFYSSGSFYKIAHGVPPPESYRVLGVVSESIVQSSEVRWPKQRQVIAETRAKEEKKSESAQEERKGESRSESDSDSPSVSSVSDGEEDIRGHKNFGEG